VLDLESGEDVSVVGDAHSAPVATESVDVVLCTQVLEHVPHPQAVVAEIHRMLRPGGHLLLTVPSIFPQHGGPGDYWRYTPDGLGSMLRAFRRVDVQPEAGTLGSFFLVVNMYLFTFTGGSALLRNLVSWLICPITNLAGLAADAIYRGRQFPSNLFVVATR
jgi:2-polyprenyl-3-methyl-5-hydroxy-6-metoxy-1,4-benzoquinol methylase